jgi:hypothetical protein
MFMIDGSNTIIMILAASGSHNANIWRTVGTPDAASLARVSVLTTWASLIPLNSLLQIAAYPARQAGIIPHARKKQYSTFNP